MVVRYTAGVLFRFRIAQSWYFVSVTTLCLVSVTMTVGGRLSPYQLPAYLAGQLLGAALGTVAPGTWFSINFDCYQAYRVNAVFD